MYEIVVQSSLIIAITLVIVFLGYRRFIYPTLSESLEALAVVLERATVAERAIKTGMSALGVSSQEKAAFSDLENEVLSEVIEKNFPEVQYLLEQVSPDLAERLRENPEQAVKLYEKYEPILARFGLVPGGEGQREEKASYMYG